MGACPRPWQAPAFFVRPCRPRIQRSLVQPRAGLPDMNPADMNQAPGRKQQLLKRHRRNKRIVLLVGLVLLVVIGVLVVWWLPLLLAVIGWVAHEAWFADHLLYSVKDDYQYAFPDGSEQPKVRLDGTRLRLDEPLSLAGDETLVLAIRVKSNWLGRFLDPAVELLGGESHDQQTFERGVNGLRYLNLSGLSAPLAKGELLLKGRYCRLLG